MIEANEMAQKIKEAHNHNQRDIDEIETEASGMYRLEISGFLGFKRFYCKDLQAAREQWRKAKQLKYRRWDDFDNKWKQQQYVIWELFNTSDSLVSSGEFER